MTKHSLLRKYLLEYFAQEAQELSKALFIPLGPQVQKVIDALIAQGELPKLKIARGVLHPSGNNTYRIIYLIGDRQCAIPHRTNPAQYDQGRGDFRRACL